MSLAKSLIKFLKNRKLTNITNTPEGMCPNCWGRQEYGGRFYARIKQENLDVNSLDSNVGWVQAYANKHLLGISLVRTGNGTSLVCSACKTSYQH